MRRLHAVSLITLAALLTGCYEPTGDTPEPPLTSVAPDYTPEQRAAIVNVHDETLDAPAAINAPPECQQLTWRRYARHTSASPSDADAVLVLMPGMLAAANTFSTLGPDLVFHGAQRGLDIQVVALNRRSQCLADLTGMNAAEAARDIEVALDYYYRNVPIDGRSFAGFVKGPESRFLVDIGVAQVVQDTLTVAQSLIPDPERRRETLFIGGHSLGGNLTSAFMGWDFDGDPRTSDDAGHRQAAGFIRLDISVTPEDPALDPFLRYAADTTVVNADDEANRRYRSRLRNMRLGVLPRYMTFPGVNAESLALLDAAAMLANWAPDEEHTLVRTAPLGDTPRLLMRLIHSRDFNTFLAGTPKVTDFRYTNEALLGMILDDQFMPVNILQTSLGFLNGGRVTDRRFPNDPTLIRTLSVLSPFIGFILADQPLVIAGDAGPSRKSLGQGPLYGWTAFDEIGADGYHSRDGQRVFTRAGTEVTDIQAFARAIHEGPHTLTEWYQPMRLNVDMEMLQQTSPVTGLNFWHYPEARAHARLIDIVGDESIADPSVTPLGTRVVATGYNHLDVVLAASDRSARRANPVIGGTLDFVTDTLSQADLNTK